MIRRTVFSFIVSCRKSCDPGWQTKKRANASEKLIELLCDWSPSGGQDISTWEKWTAFEAHASTIFDNGSNFGDIEKICLLLNGFASFQQYRNGDYTRAEPLYRRALEVRERVLGEEHPSTLSSINNLAGLLDSKGEYGEAEPGSSEYEDRARELGKLRGGDER